MVPETELYQLSKLNKEMFLIIDKRVHPILNSRKTGNLFFSLCGLNFPLGIGEPLQEIEERYCRRNKKEIEKEKIEKIGELNDRYIKNLDYTLKQKEDIVFFLSQICPSYDRLQKSFPEINVYDFLKKNLNTKKAVFKDNQKIFEELIDFDCAIILGRLYSVKPNANSSYELVQLRGEMKDVEKEFQKQMKEKITEQAIFEFENSKENIGRISELEEAIEFLAESIGAKKYAHCYECGDIGYDFSSKLVYWLITHHNNETTGKSYGDGESAVTLELSQKKFGSNFKFAERAGMDNFFSIHSNSNCYGNATKMKPFDEDNPNSLDNWMYALKTCAVMVGREGRFYQAPTPSTDSGGYD